MWVPNGTAVSLITCILADAIVVLRILIECMDIDWTNITPITPNWWFEPVYLLCNVYYSHLLGCYVETNKTKYRATFDWNY